ncbi:NADH dehydrogenase [Diaminobutyricimonas aerilata]|uniref:NADH dehydrogenase n=1 Tax=Diaminobutyricimonas aerilata TaxID=1162967 RepID=A0A2M9CM41_9MICO|nr:FAD-dependent oxidoreductase [Diaminobutyricimonas aerilata]PJJ72971.1 NADH dehydrogenase [Diaminobutyricimonas aerilata]
MSTSAPIRRVVVIGAGYAGVMAANRLRHLCPPDVEVMVVSPRATFVDRIRLHEHVATGRSAEVPLTAMLTPGIRHRLGRVQRIDAAGNRVLLDDGTTTDYDYLVYAVGSGAADARRASLNDLEAAHDVRERMRRLPPGATVTVVGGGATGIETAAEIADRRPLRVTLVTSGVVAPMLGPVARRVVRARLRRLRVGVLEHARVEAELERHLLLADGRRLASDLTIWSGSFAVPELAAESGLTVDRLGRLLVDERLASVAHPRIFGAGDAVAMPAERQAVLRMACATALPMGAHVAEMIAAEFAGGSAEPFSNRYIGLSMSLGRGHGVVQLTDGDGRPKRTVYVGLLAAAIKELTSRYALGSMPREARRAGSYRWKRGWEGEPRPRRSIMTAQLR